MNQSEMILEFIDGTLDGGREQRLFDEMAQRPELRAELRQYVMIGDAVRADREAYSPPADVERRLLGGLGILPFMETGGAAAGAALGTASAATGGSTAAAGTASVFGWLGLAKLKSALLPLVVGLILGGAAGGGGVYLAVRQGDGSGTEFASVERDRATVSAGAALPGSVAANGASNAPGSVPAPSSASASAIPSSSSSESSARGLSVDRTNGGNGKSQRIGGNGMGDISDLSSLKKGSNGLNELSADDPASREKAPENQGMNPEDETVLPASSAPARALNPGVPRSSEPLIEEEGLLPSEPSAQRSPATLPAPTATDFTRSAARSRFALELRKGFLSQPFADNNARQVSGDFLREDLVLGAFYAPDDNWYMGLEGGRERFAQSLFYNREDTLFVEQRPAIIWGGAVLGRKLTAFNLPFFVQGTLGASQYGGPIARGRVGFDVAELLGRNVPSTLSFPLSFEASSLVYTYGGQYLVTGNWGFSGGVRMRFGL